MERQYRYNKKAGALQEAMVSAPAPMKARAASYADAHGTQTDLTTLPPEMSPGLAQSRRRGGAPPGQGGAHGGDGRDTTRRGRYSMFWYTVEDGQRVLVTRRGGDIEVAEGPRRIWRIGRRFEPMQHYIAHPGEFLVVRFRDGSQEHLVGPAHCWLDPRVHRSITREETLQIADKEAVVVYSEAEGAVTRRIEHGPAVFMPSPGEWLHTFSWHGSVGGAKVPNALVFQKLWMMPDQMYHDVTDVRTADDAVLTIKLMLFFELVDIEKMLVTSHDPIGDFVNAATSDTVEFLSRHDFEAFKAHTDKLNDLSTYRQLTARAEQCGYRMHKVVYRGYGAPPALQKMHDEAIQTRTRLQLERQTEQQAQELSDFKLERTLARADHERKAELSAFEQRLEVERREAEARLRAEGDRRDAERTQARRDADLSADVEARRQSARRTHLAALAEMGVDLTAYLTRGVADRTIEVRGGGTPHVHLSPDE